MKVDNRIIQIKNDTTVIVGSEELRYTRQPKRLVRDIRGQVAVCLGRRANSSPSYIRVQLMNKEFKPAKKDAYWSQELRWTTIGVVDHCIAFRLRPKAGTLLGRMIQSVTSSSEQPVLEWFDRPRQTP